MRYSASVKGFFSEELDYTSIPGDCVEITDGDYELLMDGQASGFEIVPDPDKPGYPKLRPVSSVAQTPVNPDAPTEPVIIPPV